MKRNPYLEGTPDEFIVNNMNLARDVAWPFIRASFGNPANTFTKEDLLSIACEGLIKAYQRFDPTKYEGEGGEGVKFSTYAIPVIRGTLMVNLRDLNSMIRPSRESLALLTLVRKSGLTSNSPISELVEKAGLTVKEAMAVSRSTKLSVVDSLDRPLETDDGGIVFGDTIPLRNEDSEKLLILSDFIRRLEPRLQRVYQLRVAEGKSQAEVGRALKLSQVQVGRLEYQLFSYAEQYGKEEKMLKIPIPSRSEGWGSSQNYPRECKERAIELSKTHVQAGQIVKKIAEEFPGETIPPSSIHNWVSHSRKKLGIIVEPSTKRSRKYSIEAENRAKELLSRGVSSREVCNMLRAEFPKENIPASSVYVWGSRIRADLYKKEMNGGK